MTQTNYKWCVIGAGPAGLAALGQLLDHQVTAEQIVWVDPYFQVGDLGTKWYNVASNTKVKLFRDFLQRCTSFQYHHFAHQHEIAQLQGDQTCYLRHVADPLQSITRHLQNHVVCFKNKAERLAQRHRSWEVQLNNGQTIQADNVILAIGAEPKMFNDQQRTVIPLETALDRDQLQRQIEATDTIAVYGSSHSSIMAIKHLVELGAARIINFYRSTLKYAINMGDWILYDNTGLKGSTAQWAQAHLNSDQLPANLERYYSSQANQNQLLPQCHKVIYGIGFNRRDIPTIEGVPNLEHDPHTGIIAPGLFGLGIAYPEYRIDRMGIGEHRVGLKKFMDYIQMVLPIWLHYQP